MSDLGGIGGALLLSDQISTDRLFDSFRRAREADGLALNDTAWRNQYNHLVNCYNHLLQDANRLADVQDRALNAKDRQLAELMTVNQSMTAQVQQLRQEIQMIRGLIDVERAMYREKHPEDFE
jgi:hypothetical protein